MAVVVRQSNEISEQPASNNHPADNTCTDAVKEVRVDVDGDQCIISHDIKEVRVDVDAEKPSPKRSLKARRSMKKWKSFPNSGHNSFCDTPMARSKKWTKDMNSDILQIDGDPLPKLPEEEEAIGIITMVDVIEELLQHGELERDAEMEKYSFREVEVAPAFETLHECFLSAFCHCNKKMLQLL